MSIPFALCVAGVILVEIGGSTMDRTTMYRSHRGHGFHYRRFFTCNAKQVRAVALGVLMIAASLVAAMVNA